MEWQACHGDLVLRVLELVLLLRCTLLSNKAGWEACLEPLAASSLCPDQLQSQGAHAAALCHVPDWPGVSVCAEVMRWLMRPSFDPSPPFPSANITEFNRISGALGAAVAYAMTYAYQNMVSPGFHTS